MDIIASFFVWKYTKTSWKVCIDDEPVPSDRKEIKMIQKRRF